MIVRRREPVPNVDKGEGGPNFADVIYEWSLCAAEGDLLAEEGVEDDVLADPPAAAALLDVDPDRLGLVVLQREGEGVRAGRQDGGEAGCQFNNSVRFYYCIKELGGDSMEL